MIEYAYNYFQEVINERGNIKMNLAEKYIHELKENYLKHGGKDEWAHFEQVKQGAKDEHIAQVKEEFPLVPDSLLQLLAYADGTYHRRYEGEKISLYFLGSDVEGYPYYLCSCEQILESKDIAKKMSHYIDRDEENYEYDEDEDDDDDNEDVDDDDDYDYDDEEEVDDKITTTSESAKWLLFSECMNNGGTSKLFIDFTPSDTGKVGQIVRYLHDPDTLIVIADSFDDYLLMIMDKDYDFINEDTMD